MSNNELCSTSQGCGCSAGLRRSRPVAVSSAWTPACLTHGSPARTDPRRWRHTERRTPQETHSHTSTKLPVRHCLIVQNLRVALFFFCLPRLTMVVHAAAQGRGRPKPRSRSRARPPLRLARFYDCDSRGGDCVQSNYEKRSPPGSR